MQGRRFRSMNPAFAAAHGIKTNEDVDSQQSSNRSVEAILKRAQDSGKLVVSNCSGLEVPLPDEFFHFPFGYSRYTEDLLTVVDFSDNEERFGNTVLDERISKYRSVKSMRFRNCGLKLPSPEKQWSFASFENLTILDLSGNKLDGIFDVGCLLWLPDKTSLLTELNLSNNQIEEIVATNSTGSTVSLPHLNTLNVSHNPSLQRFFDETSGSRVFSCENLRNLQCHHNPQLISTTTSGSLFSFLESSKSTLEVLEVSHNPKLGSIGTIDLSEFDKLQTVNFAMNRLQNSPCISHSVKILNLRNNKLTSIQKMFPSNAPSTSQLVDLFLDDNYLADLDPLIIENMPKLKRLDLMSNKIRSLPYQLGFLTELTTVDISGNPVFTRFSSVAQNPNNPKPLLETLRKRAPTDRDGNLSLSSTTGNIINRVASNLLSSALSSKGYTTLDLAGKCTEEGSAALERLAQELRSKKDIDQRITGQLLLDSNRLESLPEELLALCLPNVQTISLTNNRLAQLPVSLQFCRSRNVKQLRLTKNQLTDNAIQRAFWFQPISSVPPSLSWSLKSLTHLDLSSNKLTSFPIDTSSSIHCFPALEVLNLFNNKITSINDWKRLPGSLTKLDLSENNIVEIELLPVLLAGCPQFQRLDLFRNNVKIIPKSLGLLLDYTSGSIVSLNLQGNPQRGIPFHVLEKPCGELLRYLSNRLTDAEKAATIEKIENQKQPLHQENSTKEASVSEKENVALTIVSEPTPPPVGADKGMPKVSVESNSSCRNEESEDDHKLLKELQASVDKLKLEYEEQSLTNAKKYAVKKALAMERSKLIREERRLGLRK